jgi:predicted RNase H-like nuclease
MQQLRSAASSVFNPPPRQVLPAENPHQFQQLHGEFFCKPANPFSYGILKKIREVDKEMNPTLQERIMEFHPEVAWKNLAGRVLPSKHGASGILSRMDLIGQHFPDLTELKKVSACAKAAIDDLLDALVGLCVAHCIAEGPDYNRRLPPNEPPRDARGLRMEIWF